MPALTLAGTRRLSTRLDSLEADVAKVSLLLETMQTNQELMLENQMKIPTISSCCSNVETNMKLVKTKLAEVQVEVKSNFDKTGRDFRIAHRRTRDLFDDKLVDLGVVLKTAIDNKTEEVLAQSNSMESTFQGQTSLIRREIEVVQEKLEDFNKETFEAIEDQTKQLAVVHLARSEQNSNTHEEQFEKLLESQKNMTSVLENTTQTNLEAYQTLVSDVGISKKSILDRFETSDKSFSERIEKSHRGTIMNIDTLMQATKLENLNAHQATVKQLKQAGSNLIEMKESVVGSMEESQYFIRTALSHFNDTLTETLVSLPDESGNSGEIIEAIDEAIGNIHQNNERINILGSSIKDLNDLVKNTFKAGGGGSAGPAPSGSNGNLVSLNAQPQGYSGFPLDLRDDIKLIKRNSLDMLSRVKSKNMTGNCRGVSNKKLDDLKKTFNSNLKSALSQMPILIDSSLQKMNYNQPGEAQLSSNVIDKIVDDLSTLMADSMTERMDEVSEKFQVVLNSNNILQNNNMRNVNREIIAMIDKIMNKSKGSRQNITVGLPNEVLGFMSNSNQKLNEIQVGVKTYHDMVVYATGSIERDLNRIHRLLPKSINQFNTTQKYLRNIDTRMLAITGRLEDLKQVSRSRFDQLDRQVNFNDHLETITKIVNMSETRLLTMNNLMTGSFEITNDMQASMSGYNQIFNSLKKTQSQILKQLYQQMQASMFLSDSMIRNVTYQVKNIMEKENREIVTTINDIRSSASKISGNVTDQQKNLLLELAELEHRLTESLDASLNRSINTNLMDRLEKLFHMKSMSEMGGMGSFTDSPLNSGGTTAKIKNSRKKTDN